MCDVCDLLKSERCRPARAEREADHAAHLADERAIQNLLAAMGRPPLQLDELTERQLQARLALPWTN